MDIPVSLDEDRIILELKKLHLYTENIRSALDQARKSHKSQLREDGKPYLNEHIYPVTKMTLDHYGNSITEDIVVAALLHDALEDDESLTDEEFKGRFGSKAYSIVRPLSKPNLTGFRSETEKRNAINKEYFRNIKNASNETKIIKFLDRIDNLYWAHTFGDELLNLYILETEKFYLPLAKETNPKLFSEMKRLLENLKK